MKTKDILTSLRDKEFSPMLASFSALDKYYRLEEDRHCFFIKCNADMVNLAKLFDNLVFTSMYSVEAALTEGDLTVLFYAEDSYSALDIMSILADPFSRSFYLPDAAMDSIKNRLVRCNGEYSLTDLLNLAVLVSRYGFSVTGDFCLQSDFELPLPDEQRIFLSLLMTSPNPGKGLSLLDKYGAIELLWPELARMKDIEHSKDYHPEGSVWQHTLEALKYPKKRLLTVTLAVLLHDVGKPLSVEQDGKRFFAHANIGESIARSFLKRLGFPDSVIGDVAFLVRHHMLPHALPSLRTESIAAVLDSPLFPLLLEVYRCDLFSTFRGPDSYYRSCKAYKAYLKDRKNPFKNIEFKRNVKLFIE